VLKLHGHDDRRVGSETENGQVLTAQMQGYRLLEIPCDLVQCSALCDDGDLEALGDIARLFAGSDYRLDRGLELEEPGDAHAVCGIPGPTGAFGEGGRQPRQKGATPDAGGGVTMLHSAMRDASGDVAQVPTSLPEPFRSALHVATGAWRLDLGERLVSLVLFGSVARGQARPTSDIDLLVVAKGLPWSLADRRRPLLAAWERARAAEGLAPVSWNLVTKSPEEARAHSPLYLDIVEEGLLILDQGGFFQAVLAGMRARMRALGSRRIHLDDGSWYWDLKPDFRFGEVVEL